MRINETCACGASVVIEDQWTPFAERAAVKWRESHKHAESVGICGDRPPPLKLGDVEINRPHCALKAGHAGMHGDGEGASWRYEAPPDPAMGAESDERGAEVLPGDRAAERGTGTKGDA